MHLVFTYFKMSYMPINGAKTWAKLVYRSSDTRKLRTAVAKRSFVKKKSLEMLDTFPTTEEKKEKRYTGWVDFYESESALTRSRSASSTRSLRRCLRVNFLPPTWAKHGSQLTINWENMNSGRPYDHVHFLSKSFE